MKEKTVLLVGNFLSSRTGTRSVCEDLSWRLANSGWHVIETSHQIRRFARLIDMVHTTLTRRREYHVAYVEVYSGLSFVWAEIVIQLLNWMHKPANLALHGGGLVNFAQKHPKRMSHILKMGQSVVTPSVFLQNDLRAYCDKIEYLPNALEICQYPFQVCPNPGPNLVWLRAFHKIYQPEMAVQVLALLKQEFTGAKLTMAGPDKKDGSLESALRLAEKLGVLSDLDVVGPVPKAEVPVWIAQGDIFLNTTRYESFGVSVLEAALIGLPIVTTSVGELPYLWENGESAMLVAENDPEAMAYAVKRILTEPGLARRLSQTARNKAEGFDWSMILPQWEKLFQGLLLD
jgi:glycosyltransferase involved in cell wall biosynthesis